MKIYYLLAIFTFFIGCSQKFYKNNVEITKNEYLFYKNRCEKNYQEYSEQYNQGGIYAIGQKRHHDEYMRECMEIINKISLKKRKSYKETKSDKIIEINLLKMNNSLLNISK